MSRTTAAALVLVGATAWWCAAASTSHAGPRDRPLPLCKAGTEMIGGKCRPPCPAGQSWTQRNDGAFQCAPPPPPLCKNPGEEMIGGNAFQCAPPPPPLCKNPGEEMIGGKCRPPCPAGQSWTQRNDGAFQCAPPPTPICKKGEEYVAGKCQPACPEGQVRTEKGACGAPQ
ncbi:MAG: hypothetical protein IPG50_34670 [Myxococcales bacterium]|nr:hypothetical protein [Myxococcales bacterium]